MADIAELAGWKPTYITRWWYDGAVRILEEGTHLEEIARWYCTMQTANGVDLELPSVEWYQRRTLTKASLG